MIGTIVNTGAILLGSIAGSIVKKGIREKYQTALYDAMGFAAASLGIYAVVQNMPKSRFPVLFILSLAAGSLLGTVLDVDGRFRQLAGRVGGSELAKGLSTGILLFCIGTLSILGPINSAVYGDHTYLFTNAALDLVTSTVLASTYGIGMALAAVVLFLWQGSIYVLAGTLGEFMAPELLSEISIVGGIMIAASGLSILKIKETKTLNMLPSLIMAAVFYLAADRFF